MEEQAKNKRGVFGVGGFLVLLFLFLVFFFFFFSLPRLSLVPGHHQPTVMMICIGQHGSWAKYLGSGKDEDEGSWAGLELHLDPSVITLNSHFPSFSVSEG